MVNSVPSAIQLVTACVTLAATLIQITESDINEANDCTALWFIPVNGSCECSPNIPEVRCKNGSIQVKVGYCMTQDDHLQSVVGPCPYFATNPKPEEYDILIDTNGSQLNNVTCSRLNRQGEYCKKCMNGHGPAIFSDSATCTDCSQYKSAWFAYFLFQILLETVLFVVLLLLRSSRVFGLINVLAFYWQMILYAIISNSSLYRKLIQSSNSELLQFLLTIYGIWNLDFLRYLLPPMCITHGTKAINTLWFDIIVALYPFLLCAVLLLCIWLHNQNNRTFAFILQPVRRAFRREWDLKDSAANALSMFLVLGYSKLLFTSLKFLNGVHVYNSLGVTVSHKPILYYDPSIKYLSSQHIPYVTVSIIILIIFNLTPLLMLILYPTHFFRKCINHFSIRRSEFLTKVIDRFQDSYKNGTGSTYDYRQLSALYMILKIGIACEYTFVVMIYDDKNAGLPWAITGLVLIGFGAVFFTVEPFRETWRNKFDGFMLTLLGLLALTINFQDPFVYIIALVISLKPWAIIGANFLMKLLQWTNNTSAIKRLKRKLKSTFVRCLRHGERNHTEEEEEPLLEESMSGIVDDMPDRIVNPSHYLVPELHVHIAGSSQEDQGSGSATVPTYGVI